MKSRLNILVLLVIFLIVGIYGVVTYNKAIGEEQTRLNREIDYSIKSIALDIESDLTHMAFSMLFIIDQIRLHKPFNPVGTKNILAEDFVSFLTTSGLFDQLRLLDSEGMEAIRANYNGGHPTLVRQKDLQNKADRYYFKKAIGLNRQEIYLSPLDLNMEHGQIEQPIKPTIRLAMPAFNTSGDKIGVMMINALAQSMVDQFERRAKELPISHLYWLNQNGYWFAGEEADSLWGFMYADRHDRTLSVRDPQAWKVISSQQEGIVRSGDQTYVFTTITPQDALARAKSVHATTDAEQWKMVACYSDDEFEALISDNVQRQLLILALTGLSLLLIFLMMLLYHHQRLRDQESREREREISQQHERMKSTGIIAGGIAHEFNNILAGMTGNVFLLKRAYPDVDKDSHIHSISNQIDRAAKLIRYLLTFARQGFIQLDRVDLSELINDQCRLFKSDMPAFVEMKLDIKPSIQIEADDEKIQSLIRELLYNAVDAMEGDKSGMITVRLDQIDYTFTDGTGQLHSGPFACLRVCDTGIGIEPDQMPYIYDPFYTSKEVGKGLGLGLSAVYGAVKVHHGDIKMTSEPGAGTCFEICLPLQQPTNDMLS